MKVTRAEANLLSAAELDLVRSKGPFEVRTLVRLIQRLRNLRDKAADLLQRQTLAIARSTGSKRGLSGKANARSGDKAEVLGRALRHFEALLSQLHEDASAAVKTLKAEAKARPKAKTASASAKPAQAAKAAASASTDKKKDAAPKASPKTAAKKATRTAKPAMKSAVAVPSVDEAVPAGGPPENEVSSKARKRLPKTLPGPAENQVNSLPSRKTRAKRAR